jgi:PAS domain S-box-containing protein
LLPLLLWAATRFGQAGASWVLLGLAGVTMGSIVHWPIRMAGQEEILMLQSIFLLVSIPVLYVAALHGDLHRSVHELDLTTQRYHMATAAGSLGVWTWDPRSDDLFLDPQLKKILGYEDHEIANRLDAWMQRYHPEDRQRVLALARGCIAGDATAFEDEHRVLHADGSTRWLLTRGAVVRDLPGAPSRLVGTCIDVTERRRLADELRNLAVLSTTVLSSLSEHIAIIDRGGVIAAVNEAWSRFGRATPVPRFERAPPGDNYLDLFRRTGDAEATAFLGGLADVLEGRRPEFHMEYSCAAPGGTLWFEVSVLPLRRSEGGAVVLHSDVTRRRQAEIESQQQRQELVHLARVGILGELSGALAHELKQPLTAILSNAQAARRLLACDPLDLPELRDAVEEIVVADKRAGEVIQRLRTLLRKGDAHLQPLDINLVVAESLELAHGDLVFHHVTVERALSPALPSVHGDRVQLQQVLLNLIMNACEAMGGVARARRVLTVATVLTDDQTIAIRVSDTAGGLPLELQGRLFEPFVSTKKHGLGLGLSISRTIVAAHGGQLWSENNASPGATFHVSLPLHVGQLNGSA